MLGQQEAARPFPLLCAKLSGRLLSPQELTGACAGLSADAAAVLLCQCVCEESNQRQIRARLALVFAGVGLCLWILMNLSWGTPERLGWPLVLAGPAMLGGILWLIQGRVQPLRDNALAALSQVIAEVHERESLEPLCAAATLLQGARRPSEADPETRIRLTISHLLVRLSPDDAVLLPPQVRGFLVAALADRRHPELTVAALLTLGSARDEAARPYAEALRASLRENIREAALECLRELRDAS
jgi:hypothetical protein